MLQALSINKKKEKEYPPFFPPFLSPYNPILYPPIIPPEKEKKISYDAKGEKKRLPQATPQRILCCFMLLA